MDEITRPSPESDGAELRSRVIGHMCLEGCGETSVIVEHVYEPEGVDTCHCGNPTHDPGMVSLVIFDHEETLGCLMGAEEALVLANRLTRAASLILESMEDVPDVEREAARFTKHAES